MNMKAFGLSASLLILVVSNPAIPQHANHNQTQAVSEPKENSTTYNVQPADHESMHMETETESQMQIRMGGESESQMELHADVETASQTEMRTDRDTASQMSMEAAMQMDMVSAQPADVRDPHAYSGGYELTSGPYTLERESQISLADTMNFTGLWVDRLEYVESHDTDAEEFEGHAWIGNSYNRVFLRSEIEIINDSLDRAEIDLLYSRAVSPFWDLRVGVRRELGDEAGRNWASIGLVGLAPYWFETDVHFFVGERGNTFLDLEAEYDLLLSQRLVLQPRLDVHAYGKTDKEMGHGKGLSVVKAGFRLRYEVDRQFAPYFGVERVVKYGETADLLTVDQNRKDTHWLMGFMFWF